MNIYMFVAEDGEAARQLVQGASQRGLDIQSHIGDTPESIQFRQNYDITTRPAVLVTLEDGSYVRMWQGNLPTIVELVYAVQGR